MADSLPIGARTVAREGDARLTFELLRLCSMPSPSSVDDHIGQLLTDGIAWEDVLHRARWHGVSSALYLALAENGTPSAPLDVVERLREDYRWNAKRNLLLTVRLLELLQEFEARGIHAVPVKGVVLANTIYENPAVRDVSDIDILVSPENTRPAMELLQAVGLRPAWKEAQIAGIRRPEYARPFFSEDGAVVVDLHWSLAPGPRPPRLDRAALLERTEELAINGSLVSVLRPEPTLLALCIHGAKHGPFPWPKLKWVRDVGELLRARPDLDWYETEQMAKAMGCGRRLRLGLRLAMELIDAPVPTGVRARVGTDQTTARLARSVTGVLLSAPHRPPDGLRLGFDIRVRDTWRDRLTYATAKALTPNLRDAGIVRLPLSLAPLYYAVRLVRLSARYLLRPARLRRILRMNRLE